MSCVWRANDVVVTIVDPSAGQTFAKELKSVNEIVPTADIPRLLSHMSLLYRRYDVILDLTSVCSQAIQSFPTRCSANAVPTNTGNPIL